VEWPLNFRETLRDGASSCPISALSNSIVQVQGERAFVETHYAVIHRLKHFLGYTDFYHHGRYLDIFELREGVWKILQRVICQDGERWFQTADLGFLLRKDPNRPAQGTTDRTDPVYLGFDLPKIIRTRPVLNDLWSGFFRLALTPLFIVRLITILLRPFLGVGGRTKHTG